MKKAFYPVIIRRTRLSQDNEGKNISGLPELKEIHVLVDFTPKERKEFDKLVKKVHEDV